MVKMYHPALPMTYDEPRTVPLVAFEAVWEPNGWQLVEDDRPDEVPLPTDLTWPGDGGEEEE